MLSDFGSPLGPKFMLVVWDEAKPVAIADRSSDDSNGIPQALACLASEYEHSGKA
jgi:hypothetical protein